jgi:hypothetical protein
MALSITFDTLYSQFCAATTMLVRLALVSGLSTAISPHTPPICGLRNE